MNDLTTTTQVYKPNVKFPRGTTVTIPQLSMVSYDNWGGLRIRLEMLELHSLAVVLEEYDMTILPDDKWAAIKLAGTCMGMMCNRYAEEEKQKQ